MTTKTAEIAALNDLLREQPESYGHLGHRVSTAGISSLDLVEQLYIDYLVINFDSFTEDNDPRGEHDFGAFEHNGRQIFWKIDYYNRAMDGGSEDPADMEKTTRVLTIMLASEY